MRCRQSRAAYDSEKIGVAVSGRRFCAVVSQPVGVYHVRRHQAEELLRELSGTCKAEPAPGAPMLLGDGVTQTGPQLCATP